MHAEYVFKAAEFVYLALVLDGFSRKVVGLEAEPHVGQPSGDGRAGVGDSQQGSRCQGWCITLIAACSSPRRSTCRS